MTNNQDERKLHHLIYDIAVDLLGFLWPVIVALALAFGAYVLVTTWLVTTRPEPNTTKINFKAACDAVNGITIWNGREYACLK